MEKDDEAEAHLRRSLEIHRAVLGATHEHTINNTLELATVIKARKDWRELEELGRAALESVQDRWGNEHPLFVKGVHLLAAGLKERGKYAEAEALLQEAIPAGKRLLGPTHFITFECQSSLAMLLIKMKKYDEAEWVVRRTLLDHQQAESPQPEAMMLCTLMLSMLKNFPRGGDGQDDDSKEPDKPN